MSLGKRIRRARLSRDVSIKDLALKIDVSPSLLSKIEHDVSNPSLDVLRKIAMELRVSVGELVEPEFDVDQANEINSEYKRVHVIRAGERKILQLPRSGATYQLLSPDLQGLAEFVWVEFEPGDHGSEFIQHQGGEEAVLVLKGVLQVCIEDNVHELQEGDSITFDARLPHLYRNEAGEKTVWVYVGVPPSL